MKRQLIAALLALNVAAVAVPSATFTVNAAEDTGIEAQAVTESVRDTALTELKNARDLYSGPAGDAAKAIINPAITQVTNATADDEIARIMDTARTAYAPLAKDSDKTAAKNSLTPVEADLTTANYYQDTIDAIKSLQATAKSDIDAVVNTAQITDLQGKYTTNMADWLTKSALESKYNNEIQAYMPNPSDKYSQEGKDEIARIKAETASTLDADDYQSQAELKAARDNIKAKIAKVDTIDKEPAAAELKEYKEAKKKELNAYNRTGNFTQDQVAKIAKYKADGVKAIDKADSRANVDAAFNAAVNNINSVLTKEDTDKAVKALIENIDRIGTVDRTNYNDKYAAIRAAQDDYNKLADVSEERGAVTNKDDLDKAEELYDYHKATEIEKAIESVEKDLPQITKENRKEYKAEIDRIKAAIDTIFDKNHKASLTTNWTAAKATYTTALNSFVTALIADFEKLIQKTPSKGPIADVADSTKKDAVTDANRAKVVEAIELYNEISEATDGKNGKLATYASEYNTLVKKLKAYTDKQEAAAAKLDLAKATIEVAPSVEYTGSELRPTVVVKDADGTIIASTEYITAYDNNVNVGKSTVTVLPNIGSKYAGSVSKEFSITAKAMTPSNTTVAVENLYYRSGKARNSVPVVKVDGREIARNTDFTVSYKNNINVGAATVTITGKDNYKGTVSASYAIMPEKAKIASLKAGAKKFTVKAVQEKGAKYQIAYKVKGTSKYKTVTTSSVSKTVKGLKKGKTYSVKVRAYQTINGKKYLGNYSNVKNVKVK